MTDKSQNKIVPCTLGRQEISENVSRRPRLRGKDVRQVLDELFEEFSDAFASGDNVKIPNFGTFILMQKDERMARNPKTKEPALVSARSVISFKASKALINLTTTSNVKRSK